MSWLAHMAGCHGEWAVIGLLASYAPVYFSQLRLKANEYRRHDADL
jgi:hypothetical protein